MTAAPDDAVEVRWRMSEADHLAWAWSAFLRAGPGFAVGAALVPLAVGATVAIGWGAARGALAGAALASVWVPVMVARAWSLRRARVLAAVRARPVTTAPAEARFSAAGVQLGTLAGAALVAWRPVTFAGIRQGFLVVESRGTPVLTVPVGQLGPDRGAALLSRLPAWRAAAPAPEPAVPPADAVHVLTLQLGVSDDVAVAHASAARLLAASRKRRSALAPLALLAGIGAAAAWVDGSSLGLVVAAGIGLPSAASASAGWWLPTVLGLGARWTRWRHPRSAAPGRFWCGPSGFTTVDGDGGVGSRTWAQVVLSRAGERWLLGVGARQFVVPQRAFPDEGAFLRFGDDAAGWIRGAPSPVAPPVPRTEPLPEVPSPFAPPADD